MQEFPGCSGAVGAHEDFFADEFSLFVVEAVRELGDGVSEDLDVVLCAVGPALPGPRSAARISPPPLPVP